MNEKFNVMFWNARNEALLIGYQSQFEFDTLEEAENFIKGITLKGCKEITINNECYEVIQ